MCVERQSKVVAAFLDVLIIDFSQHIYLEELDLECKEYIYRKEEPFSESLLSLCVRVQQAVREVLYSRKGNA